MADALARYLNKCKPPKPAALVQPTLFKFSTAGGTSKNGTGGGVSETLVDRYLARDLEPIENQLSPADLQRWRDLVAES